MCAVGIPQNATLLLPRERCRLRKLLWCTTVETA